jgi:hypothetical protein
LFDEIVKTMPPRTVKRGAALGPRRTARATRGAQKAQSQPPEAATEESAKVEEVSVQAVEEVKVEKKPVVEEKPVPVDLEAEEKPGANGLVPEKSKCLFWFIELGLGLMGSRKLSLNYNCYVFLV